MEIPHHVKFHEIMIPTTDTVRYSYLFDLMVVQARRPMLMVGPTGTGKSVHFTQRLLTLPRDTFAAHITLPYTTHSTVNHTQSVIDAKLTCRRRLAGVFGPFGGKRCVVFVDDINMPKR